jgi:8-oxo-dGTP pyrophosphatase MutT (NUDIX family)
MQGTDAHLRWGELSRRRIASCPLFDLYAADRSSAQGKRGEFWLLTAPDWVNVVPLLPTEQGEPGFLMVRQYRHGADMITTEFPAGLIETSEEPAAAAARELEEETGYRAGRLTLLSAVSPNPAFMNNRCFTFLAEDLTKIGGTTLDDLEALDPILLPVRDVENRMGSGEFVNALSYLAFLCYKRRGSADT